MALVGQEVPDEYGVSTADDSAAVRGEAELGYGLRVADENLPREGEKEREGGYGEKQRGRNIIDRAQGLLHVIGYL